MNQQIYIHYGATEFDPEKGFPIENNKGWIKPKGGLWASRINATRGWKDWCEVRISGSVLRSFPSSLPLKMVQTL